MNSSRLLRLAVLLGLAAVYAGVYVRSGREQQEKAGLDPMARDVRAVERALRSAPRPSAGASRSGPDEAVSLATALTAAHPGEAFPTFLLATAHHRLGQWAEEAAAWER